ncbi:Zinc finger protein, partial [Pseudolycoriella hygida]
MYQDIKGEHLDDERLGAPVNRPVQPKPESNVMSLASKKSGMSRYCNTDEFDKLENPYGQELETFNDGIPDEILADIEMLEENAGMSVVDACGDDFWLDQIVSDFLVEFPNFDKLDYHHCVNQMFKQNQKLITELKNELESLRKIQLNLQISSMGKDLEGENTDVHSKNVELCVEDTPTDRKTKSSESKRKTIHGRKARKQNGMGLHYCNVCRRQFNFKSVLVIHLRTHSGEKPYECKVCQKSFNRSSSLRRHLIIHSGEKPYQCTVCQKAFTQSGTLSSHQRTHSGKMTNFKLQGLAANNFFSFTVKSLTSVQFAKRRSVDQVKSLTSVRSDKWYSLDQTICPHICAFILEKRLRFTKRHSSLLATCPFIYEQILNQKLITELQNELESLRKIQSNLQISSMGKDLEGENTDVHSKNVELCVEDTPTDRKTPMKGTEEENVGDKIISKEPEDVLPNTDAEHQLQSNNSSDNFSFNDSSKKSASSHFQQRLRRRTDTSYELRNSKSSESKRKTNHGRKARKHNGMGLHYCNVCRRQFNFKSILVRHLRTHSGEKPYECKVCQKSFNQSSSLRRHLIIHSGEKPYQCTVKSLTSVRSAKRYSLNQAICPHICAFILEERPRSAKRHSTLLAMCPFIYEHTLVVLILVPTEIGMTNQPDDPTKNKH